MEQGSRAACPENNTRPYRHERRGFACTIAAKLFGRQDGKLVRTTNIAIFKVLAFLCKQCRSTRTDISKPLTVDLSPSNDMQLRARLSQETVESAIHFTKQSLSPATQIASKCNSFVNSAGCEKILGSVKDEPKIEIEVNGPDQSECDSC
jgi:hypothetical protein